MTRTKIAAELCLLRKGQHRDPKEEAFRALMALKPEEREEVLVRVEKTVRKA